VKVSFTEHSEKLGWSGIAIRAKSLGKAVSPSRSSWVRFYRTTRLDRGHVARKSLKIETGKTDI
jgi:hypothetical protein